MANRPKIVKARALVPYASSQSALVGNIVSTRIVGTTVASLGFDPVRDGFSLENYGFVAGAELDQHDMRELFGNVVCTGVPSDSCTLTPSAQQWASLYSDQASSGHCFGFSVLALRFFKHVHEFSQSQFGGTTTSSLSLTPRLQSELAYGWVMQLLPSVQQAEIALSKPTDVVKFLERALANHNGEVYTLKIYNATGGHAITPIAIQDLRNGQFNIDVYDNNFPGITRAISVDTNADSWKYVGGPNPNDTSEIYSGQGTNNPMLLDPLSPGLGVQPCQSCRAGANHRGMVTVTLGGNPDQHGHLLISTEDGRRVGYVHGHVVDEIKGARIDKLALIQDWKARPEPIYQIPAGGRLRITLDGAGATGRDPATVHITGPGFGATISNLRPAAGFIDQITLSPGGGALSLRSMGSTAAQAPHVQLALDHGSGGSELVIAPRTLAKGGQLTLALDPTANRLSVTGAGTAPAAVSLTQVGSNGSHTVSNGSVALSPGKPATFSLGLVRIG
jgi:hypothetical protein